MIPKTLHVIWLQGQQQLPDKLKTLREHCISIYKDYEHVLWDNDSISSMLSQFDSTLYNFYTKAETFAQKSDIARYVIVYLYGGIYMDTDYSCNKPLTDALGPNVNFFYIPFESINGINIFNGLFGAAKDYPALKITIDMMKNRLEHGGSIPYTTGTQLFFDSIMQFHNSNPSANDYIVFSHLQLFPCNVWDSQDECQSKWKNVEFMTHLNEGSWNPLLFNTIKIYTRFKLVIWLALILIIVYLIFKFRKCK